MCIRDSDKPINDTVPLWAKKPSEITPEQYIEFYHKLFLDANDPLFWVHINADYPLNFKGILFFPKLNSEYQNLEGQVKLYYNQVFVADNIKEVIPEYLLMLRGAIDCPELPLNVSRSYLQDNAYVRKAVSYTHLHAEVAYLHRRSVAQIDILARARIVIDDLAVLKRLQPRYRLKKLALPAACDAGNTEYLTGARGK